MKVRTVLGDIDPSQLGVTLTHEHLVLKFEKFYVEPPKQLSKYFNDGVNEKIHLKNVGFIRQYPYSSKYNLNCSDDETKAAFVHDVKDYKKFGGCSIVENTTYGINRDLKFMVELSKESGVNIIAGTAHYVEVTQDSKTLNLSVEEMVDMYTNDIIEGINVDGAKIQCGFIGEVGSVWPITNFEKKAIEATAIVQSQLKCGVSFHPGRNPKAPSEIIRLYLEAGGDAEKCVMSHLDRTLLNDEQLLEFSKLGCYCQLDLFGTEVSWYQLESTLDMPSDAERVDRLKLLKDEGKADKILMSHDVHTKHRLTSFGGHGYAHILNNVKPKMIIKGFTEDVINQIMVTNPSSWLKF